LTSWVSASHGPFLEACKADVYSLVCVRSCKQQCIKSLQICDKRHMELSLFLLIIDRSFKSGPTPFTWKLFQVHNSVQLAKRNSSLGDLTRIEASRETSVFDLFPEITHTCVNVALADISLRSVSLSLSNLRSTVVGRHKMRPATHMN
jgi:hypothetical protein